MASCNGIKRCAHLLNAAILLAFPPVSRAKVTEASSGFDTAAKLVALSGVSGEVPKADDAKSITHFPEPYVHVRAVQRDVAVAFRFRESRGSSSRWCRRGSDWRRGSASVRSGPFRWMGVSSYLRRLFSARSTPPAWREGISNETEAVRTGKLLQDRLSVFC